MILASCGAAALAAPQTGAPTSSPAQSQAPAPDRLSVETDRDSNLVIPRLPHGPALEDFLAMKPEGDVAPQMAKVTRFLQREPHDGEPVSRPTEAYLGYDDKNLYAVFVCHDDPAKVRAHEARR
jgi:hypothetical protein